VIKSWISCRCCARRTGDDHFMWALCVKVVAFPTTWGQSNRSRCLKVKKCTVDDLRFTPCQPDAGCCYNSPVRTFQAQTEVAERKAIPWYGQAWDSVTSTVKEGIFCGSVAFFLTGNWKNRLTVGMQLLLTQLLELLGIWNFKNPAVYYSVYDTVIYSSIWIILALVPCGNITCPRSAIFITTWIARFVSVTVFGYSPI